MLCCAPRWSSALANSFILSFIHRIVRLKIDSLQWRVRYIWVRGDNKIKYHRRLCTQLPPKYIFELCFGFFAILIHLNIQVLCLYGLLTTVRASLHLFRFSTTRLTLCNNTHTACRKNRYSVCVYSLYWHGWTCTYEYLHFVYLDEIWSLTFV